MIMEGGGGALAACDGEGWNMASVFPRLIVNPNRLQATAKQSVMYCMSSWECATSAQSSANRKSSRMAWS